MDDSRSIQNLILYFLKQIYKLEYLYKEIYSRRKSAATQNSYQNLHYLRDATVDLLVKSYIHEYKSFGFEEIEKNLFFCSMSELMEDIIGEELTVSQMTNPISEDEINRALANIKGDGFRDMIIPIYHKLTELIIKICKELKKNEYTQIAIELLEQKF